MGTPRSIIVVVCHERGQSSLPNTMIRPKTRSEVTARIGKFLVLLNGNEN